MATTNTIGTTGRDYSTLQAWEDALPATTTSGYIGECYNDSQFTAGVTIDGHTTGAADFITLRAATGQSFSDNASVQTNALRYNQSNGVGITIADGYATTITAVDNYVTVDKLQVRNTGTAHSGGGVIYFNNVTNGLVSNCITEGPCGNNSIIRMESTDASSLIKQCLVILNDPNPTSGRGSVYLFTGAQIYNSTIVAPSDLSPTGALAVQNSYGTGIVTNCAIFGFNTLSSGTFTFTTCATDLASPPAGVTGSLTYANQFQNTAEATADFRLKTGADCLDTGTTDTTNGTPDIAGTARPSGSAYDIGCWELVAAGGAAVGFGPLLGGQRNRHVLNGRA